MFPSQLKKYPNTGFPELYFTIFPSFIQNSVKHVDGISCENSSQLKAVKYFCKKVLPQMLDRILNMPLIRTDFGDFWTRNLHNYLLEWPHLKRFYFVKLLIAFSNP